MIKNEKQYKITKSKLKDFERSLKVCREGKYSDPVIHKAMKDSLKSQMDDLKKEIREYEKLKNQKVPRIKISSFEQLPEALIRSRISHGYTQKQFAKKLKMPEQQIQRYEAENYRAVSFETLMKIAKALKIDLEKETSVKIGY